MTSTSDRAALPFTHTARLPLLDDHLSTAGRRVGSGRMSLPRSFPIGSMQCTVLGIVHLGRETRRGSLCDSAAA
jgi:hypothetical protein